MFSWYVQKLKIMFALKKNNTETLLNLQNMFLYLIFLTMKTVGKVPTAYILLKPQGVQLHVWFTYMGGWGTTMGHPSLQDAYCMDPTMADTICCLEGFTLYLRLEKSNLNLCFQAVTEGLIFLEWWLLRSFHSIHTVRTMTVKTFLCMSRNQRAGCGPPLDENAGRARGEVGNATMGEGGVPDLTSKTQRS